MTDTLALYRAFARVVETGSFSAVARELGTSQPTVSRQIAELEERLGALLLRRTTRSLTVTDDGRIFYERARAVLDAVAEAEGAVGRQRAAPVGTLRLACPVVFGRLHIVPRLPRFQARFPAVRVDLSMNDGFADLVEEGVDLAIRVGAVADPGLVARRIGTTRRVTLASKAYLAGRTPPSRPEDLADHACVVYTRLATGDRWEFSGPDGPIAVRVAGPFSVNNSEGVREGVVAGLGIGVLPTWHFPGGYAPLGLVELLRDFEPKPLPINAVYPSRRLLSPKVRAMIDFLAHEFGLDPLLSSHAAA